MARKIGIRAVYDLSATPFFLKGSGYPEGTLFPWVVSDFSLIDAIEAGIVKIPRVPIADDAMTAPDPTFRNLWLRIRDRLPKKGRGTEAVGGEPKLPAELEAALETLYRHYERSYGLWEQAKTRGGAGTPPVFIVVCNNTNVSNLVFRYVAGWQKDLPDGTRPVVPGRFPVFNNEQSGGWSARPNTILVDSEQLESAEGMSPEFRKIAAAEIAEWKAEYRARFPGRDPETLTPEDLLREVLNTVGKPGKLGERVKCVVSVSMLTEGWDAKTVTHILGVRAFGTQLLCEQVVGRGLRRRWYTLNAEGKFDPEYAEVYGVPFSFIPAAGSTAVQKPQTPPTRVRALAERQDREITFPRLEGYRYEIEEAPLEAAFDDASRLVLSTRDIPTKTENAPIVGESVILSLDDLRRRRLQEVEFLLAKIVLERFFRASGSPSGGDGSASAAGSGDGKAHRFDPEVQAWRFPQVRRIVARWIRECLECHDNTFPQCLLFVEPANNAADKIYRAIAAGAPGEPRLRPIPAPYDTVGSTRFVDFETRREVYPTRADRCHVSHVVIESGWEAKVASALEEMGEVAAYVKNQNLGFEIPYTVDGEQHAYRPDFIVRIDEGRGPSDLLNLIVEVTGEKKKDKEAKVETASRLWVPAVNNDGAFGRWSFIEARDPWNVQSEIRAFLARSRLSIR